MIRIKSVVIMDEIEGDYSIYDLSGKAVSTGKASNQINVSSLPSGLYILTTKKGSLKFAK